MNWSPHRMRPLPSTTPMRSPSPSKAMPRSQRSRATASCSCTRFFGLGRVGVVRRESAVDRLVEQDVPARQVAVTSAAATSPVAPLPASQATVSGARRRRNRERAARHKSSKTACSSTRPRRRRGTRPRAAIWPSRWMSAPKNGLPAEHHLEAVVVGRVVRARHHDPAIDRERRRREIEHRRRPEADAHHVDAGARQALDQRRLELGRGQPPVTADRDALAAGLGQHRGKARPMARASAAEQGLADDAADVVFAQDRRIEAMPALQAPIRRSEIVGEDAAQPRPQLRVRAARTRCWLRESRPCRRNRSAGPRSAARGTAGRRAISRSSASVSWISPPAPRLGCGRDGRTPRAGGCSGR